jgi:hypothetical protein
MSRVASCYVALEGFLTAVVVSSLALSCASAPPQSPLNPAVRSVLTKNEISATLGATAYEAVERLRPRFLKAGGTAAFQPTVYLDGQKIGGVAELRLIPAMSVTEIRFLNSLEATAIFGTQGGAGAAISVTTRTTR